MATTTNRIIADLQARCGPSPLQREIVRNLRKFDVGGTLYAPVIFPWKEYGLWTLDTVVEHGTLLYTDREAVLDAARRILGDREGTIGYAAFDTDTYWDDELVATFEFMS